MKKLWGWFLAVLAILIGAFLFERKQKQKAESQLASAESSAKDQLLKYQQDQNSSAIEDEKAKLDQLRKEHDQSNKENQENLSPEQVQDYWKRKKD